MGGLTQQNAMDYFMQSQFYDRSCNNQVLNMQNSMGQMPIAMSYMESLQYAYISIGTDVPDPWSE